MNSRDWSELLTTVLLSLLTAYLKRYGEDAAQEVVSKVSNKLASSPVHEPFKLSRLSELVSFHGSEDFPDPLTLETPLWGEPVETVRFQPAASIAKEKELFRLHQGTST